MLLTLLFFVLFFPSVTSLTANVFPMVVKNLWKFLVSSCCLLFYIISTTYCLVQFAYFDNNQILQNQTIAAPLNF